MGMKIGSNYSNYKTITFKGADGTVTGTLSITKSGRKKLKKLQYNFKELSGQILRTKTSGNARQVVSKAGSKIAMLRQKLKSGEYDDKEIESAILHARQMERVARKRMKHLKEEEQAGQDGICEAGLEENEEFSMEELTEGLEPDQQELEELMKEMQELMQETMEAMEDAGGLEELSEELLTAACEDLDPADLELLKKKHRADELKDIMEADRKYLKAMFDRLQKEKQEGAGGGGVALELGGVEMPVQAAEAPVPMKGSGLDITV